ncbi:MAG: cupin domain-containing protein [Deltaproteobacteria bacterium]|nr:cupin domain-containing protein [Deltaproteobacteria bacterium]
MTGLNAIGFRIIEVQPGHETTEKHVHHFEEECVYVLEGSAEASIGDDVFLVRAGDFIGYRADGEAHSLTNNGTDVFKCIVVGQRLDHDVADYPQLKKRIFRNKSEWNLVDHEHIARPVAGKKT